MTRLFSRYRRQQAQRIGVGLSVLALCLRLIVPAWTAAPASVPSSADLVALFGGHALCIAAARGEAPAEPGDQQKAPEHDHGICCLFHANLGFTLPPAPSAPSRIALDDRAELFAAPATLARRPPAGTARARGPPPQA